MLSAGCLTPDSGNVPWLVNPLAHTLDVFRLEGNQWLLVDTFAGDQRVRAEPFDVIELALGLLWSR